MLVRLENNWVGYDSSTRFHSTSRAGSRTAEDSRWRIERQQFRPLVVSGLSHSQVSIGVPNSLWLSVYGGNNVCQESYFEHTK